MNNYLLPPEELQELYKQASRPRCKAEERLRLLCIYWAGHGKEITWIHQMLLLPPRTIYHYLEEYAKNKKTKHDKSDPGGRPPKLSEEQEQELQDHLDTHPYKSTVAIIDYIAKRYGVVFSQGGLAKWLHRHGFRYKRPKCVPSTVEVAKQEAFVALYHKMKQRLTKDEVLLFMDGVHPNHQTQNVHGWIRRSKLAQVPSTGKQKRLHYMGAVLVQKDRVEHNFKEYPVICSEAIEDFLKELMHQYPGKKLKIICDRGAYHTSKATQRFVAQTKTIELIYLPPRCPNLNLIERLWKLMREHVTYNHYYPRFADFQQAIRQFFNEKITQMQPVLIKRLREHFHIIQPVFLQTVS